MAELTKMVSTAKLAPEYVDRVRATYPDLDFTVCTDRAELPDALGGAQAMFGSISDLPADLLMQLPELRWVQVTSVGVNKLLRPEVIESDLLISNGSGINAPNIAEHLLSMILAFARRLPDLFQAQAESNWVYIERSAVFELGDQTLGILGLGDIGCELAWRADALGMRVIGSKRRGGAEPRGVSQLYAPEQLHELLAESDHVVVCLPLTSKTHHLISTAEFKVMKPSAYIYNIGRGEIIDQDTLIAALQTHEITGAGLDVTVPEPLPSDSPLWTLPGVVVTCHSSGRTPHYWTRGIDILIKNIDRFRRDEPLINLVDKHEGY